MVKQHFAVIYLAGAVFSGSTRVKERFSLNIQNHPSESASSSRVIHQGQVRNMRECGCKRAEPQGRCRALSRPKVAHQGDITRGMLTVRPQACPSNFALPA